MKFLFVCLLLAGDVSAQTRPRLSDSSAARPVNMQGTVQEVTSREIAIQLKDSRLVSFKVTADTRFDDGLTLRSLQQGDRLIVRGTQDREDYLTATEVSLDGAAMAADAIAARKAAQQSAAPAQAAQQDDPGRPVLRRGKPAQNSSAVADDATRNADNLPPDSSLKGVRDRPTEDYTASVRDLPTSRPANLNPKEELIERARDWALNFTDNLPNYVCQQYTTRYVRNPSTKQWQALDVVSANVVYENGQEDYRNVAINGRQVNKKMEDLGGNWSTGEFGTTLRGLFHPARETEFTYVKQSLIGGLNAWVYDFKVRRENSDWHIQIGAQSIIPGYAGRVWIEEKTGQVLRIEKAASDIPRDFPLDQVEASNDYGFVRLATAEQYMLPTHAEILSCERGSPVCGRNTIEFRNYHKYTGEANLVFDK